jgi:hypothetical protein
MTTADLTNVNTYIYLITSDNADHCTKDELKFHEHISPVPLAWYHLHRTEQLWLEWTVMPVLVCYVNSALNHVISKQQVTQLDAIRRGNGSMPKTPRKPTLPHLHINQSQLFVNSSHAPFRSLYKRTISTKRDM